MSGLEQAVFALVCFAWAMQPIRPRPRVVVREVEVNRSFEQQQAELRLFCDQATTEIIRKIEDEAPEPGKNVVGYKGTPFRHLTALVSVTCSWHGDHWRRL